MLIAATEIWWSRWRRCFDIVRLMEPSFDRNHSARWHCSDRIHLQPTAFDHLICTSTCLQRLPISRLWWSPYTGKRRTRAMRRLSSIEAQQDEEQLSDRRPRVSASGAGYRCSFLALYVNLRAKQNSERPNAVLPYSMFKSLSVRRRL